MRRNEAESGMKLEDKSWVQTERSNEENAGHRSGEFMGLCCGEKDVVTA